MKRKHKRNKPCSQRNCFTCGHCLYIGEGDYLCDAENEIVRTDFNEPTEEFYCCGGKEFIEDED